MQNEKINEHIREILQQNILLKEINESLEKKLRLQDKAINDIEIHRQNQDKQESILLEELYKHYSKLYEKMQKTVTSMEAHAERVQIKSRIQDDYKHMLLSTNMDGIITDCNEDLCNHINSKKEYIVKTKIQDIIKLDQSWKEFLSNNEQVKGQLSYKTISMPVVIKKIDNNKSKITFAVKDISEIQDIEKEVKRLSESLEKQYEMLVFAEQKKDEFYSHLSHELKTPLVPIIGIAEILEKNKTDITAIDKTKIEIIKYNAKILNDYITKIIDVHKLSLEKFFLRKSKQDIFKTIEDVCNDLIPIQKEKQIKIINQVKNQTLDYDEYRISQVVTYILENSIKFSQSNSTVTISSISEPSKFIISITDQGKGIGKDIRERVFEKCFQENSDTLRGPGGLGLGLTIAKGIVERHEGKIWVDDTSKGCKISFYIPINGN